MADLGSAILSISDSIKGQCRTHTGRMAAAVTLAVAESLLLALGSWPFSLIIISLGMLAQCHVHPCPRCLVV